MPLPMKIYVGFFAVILTLNMFYCTKHKLKTWLLLYELFSGLYMLLLIVAYWYPIVGDRMNVFSVLPFFAVLAIDFYFSIWADMRKFNPSMEISDKELEASKILSLLMASPAYVTGALFSFHVIAGAIS